MVCLPMDRLGGDPREFNRSLDWILTRILDRKRSISVSQRFSNGVGSFQLRMNVDLLCAAPRLCELCVKSRRYQNAEVAETQRAAEIWFASIHSRRRCLIGCC